MVKEEKVFFFTIVSRYESASLFRFYAISLYFCGLHSYEFEIENTRFPDYFCGALLGFQRRAFSRCAASG